MTYEEMLGYVVRIRREASGLSQAEMAKRMNMSQGTWSRLETGVTSMKLGVARRAARVFDLQPSELLAQTDAVAAALGIDLQ